MIALFLIAVILALPAFALWRAGVAWLDGLMATFVWAWAALVLTANVLSPFGQLGNRSAYAATMLLLSVGGVFLIGWLSRRRRVVDEAGLLQSPAESREMGVVRRALFAASVTLLALGLAWNLLVGLAFEPVNPDSLMYRLPRVWWYLGQGNLRHFAESVDPRVLYYPFNVTLAYLPLALFGAAPNVLNLVSVTAWAVAAVAAFRTARWMGADRAVAAFVSFLIAFAPIVFVEATSTNDEIIAAAGVVAGLYFFLCYLRAGNRINLVTAAFGLGCGLGSKLHFFFFWPALLLLGGWLLVAAWRQASLRRFIFEPARWHDFLIVLTIVLALSTPFLIYNRLSSPHFAYSGDSARNSPFSLRVARQTTLLLTGQLFLNPFPSLETSPKIKVRKNRIDAWNLWWNERVFTNVDQSPAFTLAAYRFRGVTDPAAATPFENTAWVGLLPWLLPLGGLALTRQPGAARWLGTALATALVCWWFAYCGTMRYFDTVGVYVAYPVIICGSFLAIGLMPGRGRVLSVALWTVAAIVAGGHLVLCANFISYSYYFNPGRLAGALLSSRPVDFSAPRFGLDRVLPAVPHATILATHWAVPSFEIMKAAPSVCYGLAHSAKSVQGPILFPVQASPAFDGFLPVKIKLPTACGLVYLDTINCSFGPEFVFGDAPSFEKLLPTFHSRYRIFQVKFDANQMMSPVVRISSQVLGAAPTDPKTKIRYNLSSDEKILRQTPWQDDPAAVLATGGAATDGLALRIEVADEAGSCIGVATFHPFRPPGLKSYTEVEP